MRAKIMSLVLAAGVGMAWAFSGSLKAQEVQVYMGLSPESNKKVCDLVQQKTGVTLLQRVLPFKEIEAQVKSEAPNFNADMILGCGSWLAFLAKKNGWSLPYQSPGWQGASKVFADPEGRWFNIANRSFVLVGNRERLAKVNRKMPESWKNLLDPQWKGEIVMPSPLSSSTANMMRFSFLALYGDAEGWSFLESLDRNIHHYTRSGKAPTDLVGRGEFLLGITSDENVKARMDQGFPLVWSIPLEGTGWDGTFVLLLNGAKNLEGCKRVVDFLGSQEMSDLFAGLGYVTPRPAPNPLYGKTTPRYIDIDLGKAAEDRSKNNDLWKAKFRAGFH